MRLSNTTSAYMTRQDGSRVPMMECIGLLHSAGFRRVDAFFGDSIHRETELTGEDWMDWAYKTRERLDGMGMEATQSHAPFYNMLSPGITDRAHKEEMVRRAIVASAILGVKWVTLHPGTNFEDNRLSASFAGNLAFFKPFLEVAEKAGTGIAIENLCDHHRPSTAPTETVGRVLRRFGGALDELTGLVDRLGENFGNVGVCWDIGHAHLVGQNHEQCLRVLGGRLKSIHVHDNQGSRDVHMPPYTGTVPWDVIVKTLRDIDYGGDFTLECFRFTNGLTDELVPEALRYTFSVGRRLLKQG